MCVVSDIYFSRVPLKPLRHVWIISELNVGGRFLRAVLGSCWVLFPHGYRGWGAYREKPAVSRRAGLRASRHEGSTGEARMDGNVITMLGNSYTAAVYLYTADMYKFNERAVSAAKPLSGCTISGY